ncbi:hypothetical protein J4217_04170 [Candidatus Pacearchaeota archaeon]|nr:hypothetical protein [Candidatus Pacearchaeota archaeon]
MKEKANNKKISLVELVKDSIPIIGERRALKRIDERLLDDCYADALPDQDSLGLTAE